MEGVTLTRYVALFLPAMYYSMRRGGYLSLTVALQSSGCRL